MTSARKPVIAVVDDDPLILKLMDTLLKHEGYEVLQWSESATAFEMIQKHRPDLVTLDLLMQDDWNAGLKVLESLHNDPVTRNIPVIIVSGNVEILRGNAGRLEALAYARLYKPVAFDLFFEHIASALKQRSVT